MAKALAQNTSSQILALTVLNAPYSLDSGRLLVKTRRLPWYKPMPFYDTS